MLGQFRNILIKASGINVFGCPTITDETSYPEYKARKKITLLLLLLAKMNTQMALLRSAEMKKTMQKTMQTFSTIWWKSLHGFGLWNTYNV